MRYSQLRAFDAVARHGSFSRAARELAIGQPAVSIQVRALERDHQLALFDRKGRQVELTGDADRELAGFSKGMRQRTKVAAALVNAPEVLVLDEPLNGTDPVQRARLIDIFRDLGDAGHTVIVSSHVLSEVERMADRVLAMVDGKLAAAGDIAAIRAAMSDIPFVVRIDADVPRRLGSALLDTDYVRSISVDGETLHVETNDLAALGGGLPTMARDLDVRLTRMEPEDESLESVFRYLVRRR